ncbi:glycosyltransferase [Candidatus Gottesmanbacteria bacterium]|nr:glycosyltransferase [Candidatus Gottesmanbacteria bacterium]
MIYISIIIPAHNSADTLPRLLRSIVAEKPKNTEIIIIDDASKEELRIKELKNLRMRIFHLKTNRGPAYARNFGAKKARGEVLLFLDSDVVVLPGTITEVVKIFQEDKYRVAATGVWDKQQNSHKFFPKFKALRDWSYWVNEKKIDSYYYLFSTRIAAIRKDVFLALGGFKENYSGADVEDIEFTYRLARKYRIDFDQNMRVHHEFENFWPIAKKYFKRAYQWVEIFQNRKKFDPVATTGTEAITTLSAVGLVGSLVLFLIALSIVNLQNLLFVICLFFFVMHLIGVHKFLLFVYKEEGLIFTIKAFFVGIALYVFIFAGALWGILKRIRHSGPSVLSPSVLSSGSKDSGSKDLSRI